MIFGSLQGLDPEDAGRSAAEHKHSSGDSILTDAVITEYIEDIYEN